MSDSPSPLGSSTPGPSMPVSPLSVSPIDQSPQPFNDGCLENLRQDLKATMGPALIDVTFSNDESSWWLRINTAAGEGDGDLQEAKPLPIDQASSAAGASRLLVGYTTARPAEGGPASSAPLRLAERARQDVVGLPEPAADAAQKATTIGYLARTDTHARLDGAGALCRLLEAVALRLGDAHLPQPARHHPAAIHSVVLVPAPTAAQRRALAPRPVGPYGMRLRLAPDYAIHHPGIYSGPDPEPAVVAAPYRGETGRLCQRDARRFTLRGAAGDADGAAAFIEVVRVYPPERARPLLRPPDVLEGLEGCLTETCFRSLLAFARDMVGEALFAGPERRYRNPRRFHYVSLLEPLDADIVSPALRNRLLERLGDAGW